MANKAGFKVQEVGGMLRHYARVPDPETGEYIEYPRKEGGGNIDEKRTGENYCIGICHDAKWVYERLKGVYQRPQDIGKAPVLLDIVVTLPQDEPMENARDFFQAAYDSLAKRYGKNDTLVGCWVHRDEARPHLHFSFLPIIPKKMKGRPEVKEGISQAAYFPKKSSLREMHETLQDDISNQLGHRVAILNGATKGKNKTVSALKAETARKMEKARENSIDLQTLIDKVAEGKTYSLLGKTQYKADPDTLNSIIELAKIGAEACRTEDERAQVVQNTRFQMESLHTELKVTRAELATVRQTAAPYLAIPKTLREHAEKKLEDWRQSYRDRGDEMNRRICKLFLDNGRDFRKTVKEAAPLLDTMGIERSKRAEYVRGCLKAVMIQARKIDRARRPERGRAGGGGYTPPQRSKSWEIKQRETNFFPSITNPTIPDLHLQPGEMFYKDWSDMTEEEKEHYLAWKDI